MISFTTVVVAVAIVIMCACSYFIIGSYERDSKEAAREASMRMAMSWAKCFDTYSESANREIELQKEKVKELEVKIEIQADLIKRYRELMAATPASGVRGVIRNGSEEKSK